jgi:hypothetical protein
MGTVSGKNGNHGIDGVNLLSDGDIIIYDNRLFQRKKFP